MVDWDDAKWQKYRELSKKMRQYPAELASLLGEVPPISLHLFVWREFGEEPLAVRPNEVAWAKFIAANDGHAAKAISGWEKWFRYPDPTGCFRFFGGGSRDALKKIEKVVTDADRLLSDYEELRVPEELEWKLPNAVRSFYGYPLPDFHCMTELICRARGYDSDDIEILVAKAGLELRPVTEIDLAWSDVSELALAGIYTFNIHNFAAAFASAVEEWLPEGLEFTRVESVAQRPLKPASVEPEPDFLFAYEARQRQWHVRFRWGDGPVDVEDEWLPHKRETEYVAYMLERPYKWIPCTELFPTSGPNELRSAVKRDDLEGEEPLQRATRQGKDDPDKEQWKALWREINRAKAAIQEARRKSDAESEAEHEKELENLFKSVNEYTPWGELKKNLSSQESRDANRVRNAINRFKAMLLPGGRHPLPRFYGHLKAMEVSRGSCLYLPPQSFPSWKVIWPSKAD